MARIDESREMDAASRRTFRKFEKADAATAALYAPYRRNLIHNGEMQVSQRYALSAFTAATIGAIYTDRWAYSPPPGGLTAIYPSYAANTQDFSNWMIIDAGGGHPVFAAGEFSYIRQGIEGVNLQHLQWGTSNAKSLCFSFYAFTQTPGTYIVEFELAGTTISRAVTIGVTTARYSITIPGNTTTVIPFTVNATLFVNIWLGAATTYSGGASLNQSWATSASVTNQRAFGQTNHFTVAARQFWLSGCQLEIGTAPTAFEHLPYAQYLQDCQRYFRSPISFDWFGSQMNTTSAMVMTYFNPPMRLAPTVNQVPGTLTIELPFIAFITLTSFGSTASSPNAARAVVQWAAAAGAVGYPVHNNSPLATLNAEI